MDTLAMVVPNDARRLARVDMYERALDEAAAARHTPFCGELEDWVRAVRQTRREIDWQIEHRYTEGT